MNASSIKQDTGLFRRVLGTLNEAQRRWLVGREALRRGRGGIERMVEASGLSKPTMLKGIRELRGKRKLAAEEGRVRKPGGGRKPIEDRDPDITRLLEDVMDESTVGDPMSPLKWNSKSTYQIQQHLASQGHRISEDTIQRRLRKLDYSLQANRKDKEGESHADRDRQFRYISETDWGEDQQRADEGTQSSAAPAEPGVELFASPPPRTINTLIIVKLILRQGLTGRPSVA